MYLYSIKPNNMKNLIESKLKERTTEQLMEDARVAKDSQEDGSSIIFCLALSVIESRMTEDDYAKFENSL